VATPTHGFSPYVQEQVGWYVYLLRDPRDGQIFYVGKGRGDRVFQHAKDALVGADEVGDKLGRIRAIHAAGTRVQAEILRHHIGSEAQAYVVEAAVIDAFRALGRDLDNEVLGHHALYGWATTDVVASIYDAPPLDVVEDSIVFLKVPRLWTPTMEASELFEAARGWWRVGATVSRARYAVAVNLGVTRAVYEIEYWRERVGGDRDYDPQEKKPRIGWWGSLVTDRPDLLNRSIRHLKQSAGSPVVYLNCGPDKPNITNLLRDDDAQRAALDEGAMSTVGPVPPTQRRRLAAAEYFGDSGPWILHLGRAWRMAAGELLAPPSDPTSEYLHGEREMGDWVGPHGQLVAYWAPLLHLLVRGLGWRHPLAGMLAWRRRRYTADDDILRVVRAWWSDERLTDYAAWASGSSALDWLLPGHQAQPAAIADDPVLAERSASRDWQAVWGGGHDPLHLAHHVQLSFDVVAEDGAGRTTAPGPAGDVASFLAYKDVRLPFAVRRDDEGWTGPISITLDGIGSLGTFRSSPTTALWHRTTEEIHLWGNPR
jgi:hypothetical protein